MAMPPENPRSLPSTCRDALMPRRQGYLRVTLATRHTVHLEHRRSLPSTCKDALMPRRQGYLRVALAPRHTVRPEHRRSLPSMAPRHTVRPEHKKPVTWTGFHRQYLSLITLQ